MNTRLETPRLVIRTFEARDADPWFTMVSEPEFGQFLPAGPPRTLDSFQGVIEARHEMEREVGYAMWAVDEKATGAFVGQCGIRPVDEGNGPEVDLAYHFRKASWNKGYATEAALAVLAHALGPIGLDRVMAVALPQNVGSWRVMEKAGMRYQGRVDYFGLPGLVKYLAERSWWTPPPG